MTLDNPGVREAAFQVAIEKTLTVLKNPEIIDQLGNLAFRLSQTVEGMYLPILENGRMELPDGCILSNNYGLLPHTDTDLEQGMILGSSLLTPTSNRLQQVVGSFGSEMCCSKSVAVKAGKSLIGNVLASRSSVPFKLDEEVKGTTSTWVVTNPNDSLSYRTRPVIHTSTKRIDDDPYRIAGTLGHEIIHGDDYEEYPTQVNYDDTFHARTELRAYHVGAVIKAAGGVLEGDGKTQAVEELRLKHTSPSAPFDPSPTLVKLLSELGVLG